jgi:hypothetical protein
MRTGEMGMKVEKFRRSDYMYGANLCTQHEGYSAQHGCSRACAGCKAWHGAACLRALALDRTDVIDFPYPSDAFSFFNNAKT